MLDGLSSERLTDIVDSIPLKRTGTTRETAGGLSLSGFRALRLRDGSHHRRQRRQPQALMSDTLPHRYEHYPAH
jgi:hypothetical protein